MSWHDSTTAICLFRPVSAEQEAEEARRRDLELYATTPPDTPTTSSLRPNPKTPIPHARPAGSCINNTAAATNNFSQSRSLGSCQRDFSRITVAGPNVASKDDIMESIAQVNQGDQYQQRICELFRTLLDPAGPVPLPLGSAIAHHPGASSGETDAIQDVSAVTVHARHGSLDDGWASSVQTTSQATTSGATTPFQHSFDGTASRMSPDIAALNDHFAKLSLTMGQRGFGRPQVENATRAAENKPDLADRSLLDVGIYPRGSANTDT
ncbi:hypothetical protein VPNG_07501 [Cytospora leucostoma]|uniref:Uncharacterized protein n=1 Tax=Cytospora leucostoma TaxID=1230097 RepID=A0A423WS13_9PEZI|nr:hypothetical protein VPNG_07501 [Cytospora leucostoma]